MAGIYLHIPYCKKACHYCDFHFSTKTDTVPAMVEAICTELEQRKNFLDDSPLETIYFGGGTPSVLNLKQLSTIFETLRKLFDLSEVQEITFEANPDDLSLDYLYGLKALGINRLSIGIQSLNDGDLSFLNRNHNANSGIQAYYLAREAGFENINLDIIFSLINSQNQHLKSTIDTFLKLRPEHISAYSLTIEPNTVFGKWHQTGKLKPIIEEESERQFLDLHKAFEGAGYTHYEVSNYALKGKESVHNGNYWKGKPYLGIGPSAHSFDGINKRSWNIAQNVSYINSVKAGNTKGEQEVLSKNQQLAEYLLTRLRTLEGISLPVLKAEFDYQLTKDQVKFVEMLANDGLAIHLPSEKLNLSPRGWLLADGITERLLPDYE